MHFVSAVIPAYNEEKTVGKVVSIIKKIEEINEIFVVSDGSVDKTVEVAKLNGAQVIELKRNIGKGGAVKAGVDRCSNEVILLLDADLMGLTERHIYNLLFPVLHNEVDMSIGVFNKGRFITDLAQKLTPQLSGQRTLKRYILQNITNIDITRYGFEVALTRYVARNKISTKEVLLNDLTHILKEEKLGLLKGTTARFKMYWEIAKEIRAKRC